MAKPFHWKNKVITMDYGKLDAGLQVAIRSNEADPGIQYVVFIHTAYPPGEEESQFLQDVGVPAARPGKKIITATLTAGSIGILSDQSFVTAIRLSRTLKPLKKPK
jgi:hypothetical protein